MKITDTIYFDPQKNLVIVDGVECALDDTESKLLKYLYDNRNDVCTYEDILSHLYKEDDNPQGRNEGNIRTYISRIKKKTNGALTDFIKTRPKQGYEFSIPDDERRYSRDYSVEHINIDNDYFVYPDSIVFIKRFTTKVTSQDKKPINSIHFRYTWFADEPSEVIPLTSNIQSIVAIPQPDTNNNYDIIFKEPVANGEIVEYAVKVTCSNVQHHFKDFFSTQIIVPIRELHIHLYIDEKIKPMYYSTQVLSDSLRNKQTEKPVEHEYFCPVHWHIKEPKLHFEYMIFWK